MKIVLIIAGIMHFVAILTFPMSLTERLLSQLVAWMCFGFVAILEKLDK